MRAGELVGELTTFDADWRFLRGDAPGAENPGFDDAGWRRVDAPHDWSIEDLPAPAAAAPGEARRIVSGPFDSNASGGADLGFMSGGTGWYRKHFTLPELAPGASVLLRFDGVYMNADVWINGAPLGSHPYGFTPFAFELAPYLRPAGRENVLAVRVRNEGRNSRWYAGSGIYRHVWLGVRDAVHVADDGGVFVTTPEVDEQHATVNVATSLENGLGEAAPVALETDLVDPAGCIVARQRAAVTLSPSCPTRIEQRFEVLRPHRWSPETPVLYRAVSTVERSDRVAQRIATTFGIRSFRFDPDKGFSLNGRTRKLKGGCMHENNGPLGAAAFDRAEERRVELLKSAGFDAVRCAHNPSAPAFLDACDRLGLLVIDEAFDAWVRPHPPATEGYHLVFEEWWERDLVSGMVRRDRNHPSVILWSIGNQIVDSAEESGVRNARRLAAAVRAADPTRPVTSNVFGPRDWKARDQFFSALDVAGYSYARAEYDADHARVPGRVIVSTEIDPAHSFANWMAVLDRDFVAGNFEWTAFDYMGEAGLGWWSYGHSAAELWPWQVSYTGDFDVCGFRRPRSYYRDALWSGQPVVAAFVRSPEPSFAGPGRSAWGWDDVRESWTWPGREGTAFDVDVYSNCERVQLTLNGRDLGTKLTSRATEFRARWSVPYAPGTLLARGFTGECETACWELRTAGDSASVRLKADRNVLSADGQDLAYVTAEIVDASGSVCPNERQQVEFLVEGPGQLAGVGSSQPDSTESFQQSRRTAWRGRCLAIVRTSRESGRIVLTARVGGLPASTLVLDSLAGPRRG